MAKWQKGESGNVKGRPKGAKGQFTQIKAEFFEAFQKLGGVDGLVEWIEQDDSRRKNFYDWVVRLLPNDISIETDRRSVSEMTSDELAAILGDKAA